MGIKLDGLSVCCFRFGEFTLLFVRFTKANLCKGIVGLLLQGGFGFMTRKPRSFVSGVSRQGKLTFGLFLARKIACRCHGLPKGCLCFIRPAHHVVGHAQMKLDFWIIREIPGAFL
jgi:hypothetical protein